MQHPSDQFNFLRYLPNVQLNLPVPQPDDIHWYELTYFYRLFMHLAQWDHFLDYSFVLVSAKRPLDVKITKHHVVFLTSNEDHTLRPDLADAGLVITPFRPPHLPATANVISIPLGANGSVAAAPVKPLAERTTDVYFSGQINRGRVPFWVGGRLLQGYQRAGGFSAAAKIHLHFTRGFAQGVPPQQYAQQMADAKITLAPGGWTSPVSHRFFEAARLGSIIISGELPPTWHYQPFPGIIIRNWLHLPRVVNRLLKNPTLMQRIHEATLDYYRDYCDEGSVAQYLIQAIRERMPSASYAVSA